MVYVSTVLFFFSLSLSFGKRSTIVKIWGGGRGAETFVIYILPIPSKIQNVFIILY